MNTKEKERREEKKRKEKQLEKEFTFRIVPGRTRPEARQRSVFGPGGPSVRSLCLVPCYDDWMKFATRGLQISARGGNTLQEGPGPRFGGGGKYFGVLKHSGHTICHQLGTKCVPCGPLRTFLGPLVDPIWITMGPNVDHPTVPPGGPLPGGTVGLSFLSPAGLPKMTILTPIGPERVQNH